jgi:Transcriptional regulator
MNLNHLTVFVTVAETGSMSEAARRLYRSQPAISQVIRELEERYQVQLFDRLGRKLYITPAGSELLKYAYHVTDHFNQMERAMVNTSHTLNLRVGASITVGTCLLPQIVSQTEKRIEHVQINSYVANTRQVEEKLLKSELDVGIVEGVIHASELVVTPVVDDYLVLACGKKPSLL